MTIPDHLMPGCSHPDFANIALNWRDLVDRSVIFLPEPTQPWVRAIGERTEPLPYVQLERSLVRARVPYVGPPLSVEWWVFRERGTDRGIAAPSSSVAYYWSDYEHFKVGWPPPDPVARWSP